MRITRIIILVCFALAIVMGPACNRTPKTVKGTVTLSGAWALYPMAVKWSEEYQKIYPEVRIDISAGGAGKGIVDCLAGIVDIGMVSRKIYPEEIEKGALAISVTRDAVVPTVNVKNPVFETLLQTGVKRESLIGIYIEGKIKNWGQVTGTSANFPIHVYTRSDACGAAEVWAEYLGGVQEDLLDVAVYGDPGLTVAVKNDVLGIGYNNINYAYDATTKAPFEGISILPIDLNGNGILDEDENFYQDRDAITQAIRMGKYPSPPARDLYFVCKGRPDEPLVREFIKWVLTEGQRYIDEAGYIQLSGEKLKEGLKKLK